MTAAEVREETTDSLLEELLNMGELRLWATADAWLLLFVGDEAAGMGDARIPLEHADMRSLLEAAFIKVFLEDS